MSQAYLKHMELVVFTYQHKKACKSYPAFYMAPKKKACITLLRAGCGEGTLNRSSTTKYIYTVAGFPQRTP